MLDWVLVGSWLAFTVIAVYRLHKRRGGSTIILPVVDGPMPVVPPSSDPLAV